MEPSTAARRDDRHAFEQLVVLYRKPAVLFALQITRDLSAAEDAVQEAFAYLWVHRVRLQTSSGIKPLLYTIVRRRCLDWFRRWRRLAPLDEAADAEEYAPFAVYGESRTAALYDALSRLPPKDARLIHLLDIEGFSIAEAADILGKTQGALKVAHHRAKARLRDGLIKEAFEP